MITTTFLGGVQLSYDEVSDTYCLGKILMSGVVFRQFTALPDWSCSMAIEDGERVVVMRRPDTTLIPAAERVTINV